MPAKVNGESVFEPTNADAKPVQLKIDIGLYDAMEVLEKRLQDRGGKLKLNRVKIFEAALRQAITLGNAELDKLDAMDNREECVRDANTASGTLAL